MPNESAERSVTSFPFCYSFKVSRMTRIIPAVILLMVLAGCEDEGPAPAPMTPSNPNAVAPSASTGTPPAATVPSSVFSGAPIEASQATGVWNQQQVEQWLTQMLKLTSVRLTPGGANSYTGQATSADGQNYDLSVKQVPGGIACRYTFGTGGKGRIAFGNPVMD